MGRSEFQESSCPIWVDRHNTEVISPDVGKSASSTRFLSQHGQVSKPGKPPCPMWIGQHSEDPFSNAIRIRGIHYLMWVVLLGIPHQMWVSQSGQQDSQQTRTSLDCERINSSKDDNTGTMTILLSQRCLVSKSKHHAPL